MTQTIVIPYKPRGPFRALHSRRQRWACVVAHRRAGKTVACVNELIKAALKDERTGQLYAYVAPFYTQAKGVAWDYLKHFSRPVPNVKINEAELRIDYPNGNRIQLFGADNADRMRGLAFSGLVADEFGDWKPSVWGYVIRPALADRQGWAVIIGTPKGRNQFCEVYENGLRKPEEWLTLSIKASESGLLPDEEIKALKSELSEDAYRQEMECDFEAALPGAFYGRELREMSEDGRIRDNIEIEHSQPVHTAWDLGFDDDTSIWFFQVVAGEVRFIDCYSASGEDIAHYANIIRSRGYRYGTHYLPHDAVPKTLAAGGRSIMAQLLEQGVKPCRIAPNLSVQDGIQAVRKMLKKTYIDASMCADGLDALRQYQREYDEDKKMFRDKPRHDWTSHYADAFRMAAVSWFAPKEVFSEPKYEMHNDVSQLRMGDLIRPHLDKRRKARAEMSI